MGGYRDDREAERARIEALERDLADANERAARAEAEAAAARAQATAAERAVSGSATRAGAAAPAKKSRAERKREKARRAAAASAEAPPEKPGAWPRDRRRVYFGASYALSLAAYCTVAGSVATSLNDEVAATRAGMIAFGVAVVALFSGHLLIGRVTRAPGIFGGAMITLISSGLALGGAMVAVVGVDGVVDSFAPGRAVPFFVHALAVAVALVLGSAVTAYWSSDVASSPMGTGD